MSLLVFTTAVEIIIPIVLIALVIAGIVFSSIQARKRREALAALAASLGLTYNASRDHSIDEQYRFLKKLRQGSNRYAFNTLTGNYLGHHVMAFDYHYETHSTNSKGHRQTHHHYFSFFILHLPESFPELTIGAEGWGSKFAQFFGYDDIDFESAEFSRKFCVRSKDKKFAYDICHAQMIEYLLANPDLTIEIENHCLSMIFPRRLKVEQIIFNLDRLLQLRNHFPNYLLKS
jgi:hypothetical protein